MTDDMSPALARLQTKLQTQLDQLKKTKAAINALHEAFDKPIPYPDIDEDRVIRTTIRRGMFYGQPLATCVRTILEMRRAAQLDAASVSEIFSALKDGGYAFDAKDDENAKNGLRQSLRKNPVFHRIPSGEWGLLSWYPNAKVDKTEKEDNGDDGEVPPSESVKANKKKQKTEEGGAAEDAPAINEQAVSAT